MESPTLARQSVSADLSEFARAEIEAFADWCKGTRPAAWAQVERLQSVCRAALVNSPEPTRQRPEAISA
jgi:plasmid stabilization system protein ParE